MVELGASGKRSRCTANLSGGKIILYRREVVLTAVSKSHRAPSLLVKIHCNRECIFKPTRRHRRKSYLGPGVDNFPPQVFDMKESYFVALHYGATIIV